MIISGYSLTISAVYARFSAEIHNLEEIAPPEDPVPPTPPMPVTPLPETGETEEKVRAENGVLRLLQEGHFKPHAEMRLLEIFHRDLAALQAQDAPVEPPPEEPPVVEPSAAPEQPAVAPA